MTIPRILFVSTIVLFAASIRDVSASVIGGPIPDSENGAQYYLLSPGTWTDSEVEAQSMGGTLAVITNETDDQWIVNNLGPYVADLTNTDLWIGLYDPDFGDAPGAQHEADFIWINGAPVSYVNWAPGEPNDYAGWGGEYYTALYITAPTYAQITDITGQWNDENDEGSGLTAYGVVEVVPEPTTFAMAGLGIVIVGLTRRKRCAAMII